VFQLQGTFISSSAKDDQFRAKASENNCTLLEAYVRSCPPKILKAKQLHPNGIIQKESKLHVKLPHTEDEFPRPKEPKSSRQVQGPHTVHDAGLN